MLTQEEALMLFSYAPDTGIVTRRVSAGNAKAGSVAGNDDGNGYLKLCSSGRYYKLHRVIWLIVHGEWPDQIDHINGVRDDNRLINLRAVTCSENSLNQAINSRNTSGDMGVYWHKNISRWLASIKINNRQRHLGSFSNKEDAIKARKYAEKEYGFHQNHGRKG